MSFGLSLQNIFSLEKKKYWLSEYQVQLIFQMSFWPERFDSVIFQQISVSPYDYLSESDASLEFVQP